MPLKPARMGLWMISLLRLSLFTLLALTICAPLSAQQKTSSIVAVVNADPITQKTLSDACLDRYGADVLENMINRHLILQECQKRGIEVTAEDVREEIQRVASKFKLSMEAYLGLLRDQRDIAPDQYSREVVWPMLALRQLVADQVEPTEEEFKRAFISNYGEAVKCRMIMVSSRSKADSLQQQAAANPAKFGQLAKQFSEDETSASVGGLIPPIRRFSGDSRLEDAAFALKADEVSPVLQLGDQWIVLQSVKRIAAWTPPPTSLPNIREQILDRIREQKMPGASGELFSQLQKQSQVVTVLGDPAATEKHPGVAAIVNGQQVPVAAVAAECVKRHGKDVLDGEINRKLLTQAIAKQKIQITQADLDAEIARAAISYGFVRSDGSADLTAWMESVMSDGQTTREIYMSDSVWPSVALKKLVENQVTITEQDIQEGYQSAFGPRVEVLAIVLSDQKSAEKIWKMARDNPSEQFFAQLAEQYSIEPVSASNQGKVPPIRKFGGQPAIEQEAFTLKPGEMSGIIAAGDKYIILRCQGLTEPIVTELAAVKDELVRDLQEKKLAIAMANQFDRLKEEAEIDNFLAAASEVLRTSRQPQSNAQPKPR
jgi:parvulin-like peptidyl-prolyl isomerase